jgi:hypothetical protein
MSHFPNNIEIATLCDHIFCFGTPAVNDQRTFEKSFFCENN